MDEVIRASHDPDMLGDGARPHAEENQPPRTDFRDGNLRHHPSRALCQNFARASLAPVPAVGRDRERLGAHHLAPDPARQPEAVAADAPETGLIVVRRAKPTAGCGDDALGIGGLQSTAPSCPPSLVA